MFWTQKYELLSILFFGWRSLGDLEPIGVRVNINAVRIVKKTHAMQVGS